LKTEFLDPAKSRSEEEFKGKINLVSEMNDVIRKNIVQAIPTGENNLRECDVLSALKPAKTAVGLKFTPDTELGDNEDIKKGSSCKPKTSFQPCQPASSKQS
jgi:hypothetical protein